MNKYLTISTEVFIYIIFRDTENTPVLAEDSPNSPVKK